MAWTNFQKSNWTRGVAPRGADQYFTAVAAGITVAAQSTTLVTLTAAAFKFQGNGPIDITFPAGLSNAETAAAQGLLLSNGWLQSPATGSYAGGNHPQIVFQVSSNTLMTVAAGGFSLIVSQY